MGAGLQLSGMRKDDTEFPKVLLQRIADLLQEGK
jgi:hypothetical protein